MKIIASLLLVGCIFASFFLVGFSADENLEELQATNELGIDSIYVGHAAMGMTGAQYKIDLANQKFWVYVVKSGEEYHLQDRTAKNEGYYFVKNLKKEDIETFVNACQDYGFEKWEEEYGNVDATDAHHWYIRVVYFDGREREVSGWSVYPDTYNQMDEAFAELTGSNLLTGAPPPPTFWFFGRPVYWW